MSRTCREWRTRALGKIDHIYEFDGRAFLYPHRASSGQAINYCRVLDIVLLQLDNIDNREGAFRNFKKITHAVDTLRSIDAPYLLKPLWALTAPKLVFARFQPDQYIYRGNPTNRNDEDCYFGTKKVSSVTQPTTWAVIDTRQATFRLIWTA